MPPKETNNSYDDQNTESLASLQTDRLCTLNKMYTNFKKDPKIRKTKTYVKVRMENIAGLYKAFSETHAKIVFLCSDRDHPYFTDEVASQFEELYIEVRCAVMEAQEDTNSAVLDQTCTNSQKAESSSSSIELPKLPLPSFSGAFVEWPAFHDAFDRLIHSNSVLNSIQKFHFLKQALPSNSDVDINQMPLTAVNYNTAWDLVVKRYENPRLLFMHHMSTFFSLPVIAKEQSNDIKSLLNIANVCINEFNRLKISIANCDQWIAYFLSTKLPKETHQAWEHHLGCTTSIPTFASMESFLNNRLVTINIIENRPSSSDTHSSSRHSNVNNHSSTKRDNRNSTGPAKRSFHTTTKPSSFNSCYLCGEAHILRRCSSFLAKDCFERNAIVDKAKLCLNCLSKSHTISQCTSAKNCIQCGQRHHTLLHFPNIRHSPSTQLSHLNESSQTKLNLAAPAFQSETIVHGIPGQSSTTTMLSHSAQLVTATSTSSPPNKVLLATALVIAVNNVTGQTSRVRALVDQGSEGTILSEHVVQALSLPRKPTLAEISGVVNGTANNCKFTVSFIIHSCHNSEVNVEVNSAYVLNSLTTKLPSRSVDPQNWPHLKGLTLADPSYYRSGRIDLIIGADMAANIILPETRIGKHDQPIAQNTCLGWILLGNTPAVQEYSISIHSHHFTLLLESLAQRFFELEQVPEERSSSEEDIWCESFFRQTHKRRLNGKYLVRLPLKCLFDPSQTLGKSKQIALNRFYSLERKFQRNIDLRNSNERCISEYFSLNQIGPSTTSELDHCTMNAANRPTVTSCVLPHHAVQKEDSLTTKLRVVFDASCKTTNGKSLDDLLCTGPVLQNDLLLNWRKHQYAFTADIQKMYRCIDMHVDDSQYQRILWRNSKNEIKEYCFTTVTFGTASAPYTAIRVLHQLAEDERESYPLAESVLKYEIYVDDILSGSYSIDSALAIRNQSAAALRSAGMELRKWSSNSTALLNGIPPEHMSDSNLLEINSCGMVKTLGMCWQPNKDDFKFVLNFELDFTNTKRSMLSTIARLFDPLGLIVPIIVSAKIIFKSTCAFRSGQRSSNLGWDETIPPDIQQTWQNFLKALSLIDIITIPLWLQYEPDLLESMQLHVFCDGSISANAACIYVRVKYTDNRVYTKLLIAKSRVTPTKPLTIPRIELCGAVLGTQLADCTNKSLKFPNVNFTTYYWTDATIVLHWIRGDPNRWQTWVSNRVNKILSICSPLQWGYVDTLQNPADCATRGLTPSALESFNLWWEGPEWLKQVEDEWPKFNYNNMRVDETVTEVKIQKVQTNFTICQDSIVFKYSSLNKILRTCAYLFRFVYNSQKSNIQYRLRGPLSVTEILQSLVKIVSLVQREAFDQEIKCESSNNPLPNGSKVRNLTPFLDENKILRVRGRLQHADLPFAQKHPIILPGHHHFTNLVVMNAHHTTLHGGEQLTLAHLRQQFSIGNARRIVRQQLQKCIKCFRSKPKTATQLMGDLPLYRVNPPQRPFLATGVDYTGAIDIKSSKYRGNTVYRAM